ncbi:MAG: hypothetical protein KC912_22005 [Proteobacteria bacterium]|nr:hypothetical protein [Pseudomonadota bacterium]
MWTLTTFFALALAADPTEPVDVPADEAPAEAAEDAETPAPEPEEAELDEPVVYTIEVDDSTLGTALDDFSDKAREVREDDPARLDDWLGMNRPVLFRGRWFAKPLLSWANLDGKSAVRPGLAIGHQWFPVAELPIQLAGETRLAMAVPAGGAKGRSIELTSVLGPWLGPVGIRVGPALRWDKWQSDAASLSDALALGARATVAVDADIIHPWVGVEPVWLVAGERDPWSAGVGELSFLGGLNYAMKAAELGLQGTWRETSAGRWLDVAFTVHVRPR